MLLTGLVCCVTALAEPTPKIGAEAPVLELPSLTGQTISLQSLLKKPKKVIVVFFASWSKPCQEELKALQNLSNVNRQQLEVLAVSLDKKSKELKNFAAEADLTFPILHDKKLSSIDKFQILIIPTTFCLGRDGVIEKVFVDYDDNVRQALEVWLSPREKEKP